MFGIYVRISDPSQKTDSQKREILRWLKGNGIAQDAVRWYVDTGSGDNLDRPEFERLQADIFHGEIRTVVVWKLDRLSRSIRDGIVTLSDWCERGLRIVSITQQLDFNGAVGRMVAAVLLGVGEMEQETRRERQAAGIAAARERGAYKGRKRGAKSKTKPTRIAMATSLRQQGKSYREIAAAMNVSKQTIVRYFNDVKAS